MPDRAVERLDPRVGFVAHETRRQAEPERRHDEGEGAMPADTFFGKRELFVESAGTRVFGLVGR
jgi:hypothetical protein